MTLEEFFDNLTTVRGEFDWNVEPDAGWYSDGRFARRGWVRGRPKTGPAAGALLDPIGAVCYAVTGKAFGEKSWTSAARTLDLQPTRAADINAAADARTWDGESGERRPVERLQSLRQRILHSVDLAARAFRLRSPPGTPLELVAESLLASSCCFRGSVTAPRSG